MKLGFVFPGQGAQYVGMGKDLYEKHEIVRKVYEKASEILNIDVAKLTFETNEEELNQTKNTQIAILVMSLAIVELLKENNIEADISAGLSLGEYSALAYSNFISFEDAIKTVRKRGEYMQGYVPEGDWSMAAIIGLEDELVEKACSDVVNGFVVPANYNCPGQVAISGEKDAVLQAMENAKTLGAKRAIELKTSGPFHTEKLVVASDKLREELNKIDVNVVADKKVIKNIDAKEYTGSDDINDILSKHVISPVRFRKSIEEMIAQGVDTFIEIGPGKVLAGFIKKTNKEVRVFNIENIETFENCLENINQ